MKTINTSITMLAAAVFLSALPAFSSSGPFGAFGPRDYTDRGKAVEANLTTTPGGTGPYGAFVVFDKEAGTMSKLAATPGGSGPFGAIASYGMIPGNGTRSVDNRDGCIMVAKNCLQDR